MSFTGTCTYVDRPGWLSCPTGMSCTCYYRYNETQYPAIELEASLSEGQLEIFASDVPNNPVLSSLPARIIPLEVGLDGSQTGSAAPYQVTVTTSGSATVDVHRSTGYVPRSFVVHTSSDCGNNGKTLECELVRTAD